MKIVIDAINDNEQVRGPDRYLIGLLQGLVQIEARDDFVIFYAPWQTFYEQLHLPSNFRFVRCFPPRGRIARVVWHALKFHRVVEAEQPDIVHLPNIIYVHGLKSPTLMTVHDVAHFTHPEKFGYLRGYLQRWLIRGAVRLSSHMLAVSNHTKAQMERYLGSMGERVTVIAEGGPDPQNVPRADDVRYFLYVGQLERSKNIESAIQAFAQSSQMKEHAVEFWIAGRPGNAAAQIDKLIRSLNDPRIRLLGYVEESRLPSLYASAVAFVFPSLVEGFGLVLLEAMAYGAPIIASSASVIPDVVGDAAVLVDATDCAALQHAMETVETDAALRAQLIAAGRRQIQKFSWKHTAQLTHDLYRATIT